jgi:transposase
VYYALEDDFEVLLVNAQHVKNVPGRKTDTRAAQWLCQLLECGYKGSGPVRRRSLLCRVPEEQLR